MNRKMGENGHRTEQEAATSDVTGETADQLRVAILSSDSVFLAAWTEALTSRAARLDLRVAHAGDLRGPDRVQAGVTFSLPHGNRRI